MNVHWRAARLTVLLGLLGMLIRSAWGQATTDTHNKKDGVQIYRVTPRVGAEIPMPATLAYHLDVIVGVKTLPAATLIVRFERGRPGYGMKEVAPRIVRRIPEGKPRHLLLTSTLLHLAAPAALGDEMLVTASLVDGKGNELSYSLFHNPLSGSLHVRASEAPPSVNKITVLNSNPGEGANLPVSTTNDFTIRFYYEVQSVRRAYVDLDFGDLDEVERKGVCWFAVAVPLKQGTGIAEVTVHHFFRNFLEGRTMGIFLALRTDPLGPSVSTQELKPFNIVKARP